MDIISIVILGAGALTAWGFAFMSWYNLSLERERSISREQQLIAAILSENVQDYLNSVDDLEKTPKDKRKQVKADNNLAIEVQKVTTNNIGIPVT